MSLMQKLSYTERMELLNSSSTSSLTNSERLALYQTGALPESDNIFHDLDVDAEAVVSLQLMNRAKMDAQNSSLKGRIKFMEMRGDTPHFAYKTKYMKVADPVTSDRTKQHAVMQCAKCGNDFQPVNSLARYCSKQCRVAAANKRKYEKQKALRKMLKEQGL